MIRIAMTAVAIVACVAAVWSQAYYEASGQTAFFTLAAGAKAGPSAIRAGQKLHGVTVSGINVKVAKSSIVIKLPALQRGIADIVFYNVAGRQVYRQHGYSGKTLYIKNGIFKSGIYAVRVSVDGQRFTSRFAITGQGK